MTEIELSLAPSRRTPEPQSTYRPVPDARAYTGAVPMFGNMFLCGALTKDVLWLKPVRRAGRAIADALLDRVVLPGDEVEAISREAVSA